MPLTEGTVDVSAILVGDWSELAVEFPAESGTFLYIGNTPEGVLEVGQEIYDHEGTNFPRRIDLRVPVRTSMQFTGQIEEIHAENVRLILGQDPSDSNPYVYAGAFQVPQVFKFRARRQRISDGQIITAVFWKASSSGLFQLGGGDEAIQSPLEVIALDDAAGNYGGSSEAPLGYIHIPAKAV
jgi:hypothetical protein